jgi:nucleoside-diphosphate-sugar epimerase
MANDEQNPTDEQPLRFFITGGDTGAGMAFLQAAARRGYKVVAATANGTEGAVTIRQLGGIPVYPDLTRAGEIRSVMLMSRADVVVHFAAQDINGPAQHAVDYVPLADKVRLSTAALVQAAGDVGVKRMILPGFAFLYGDTGDESVTEEANIQTGNAFYNDAAAAEALVLDGGIPGYVLRCGYLYGGHSLALDGLVNDLRKSNALPRGHGIAPWLHINDLIAAVLAIAERDPGSESVAQIYNLADGDDMTHPEFTKALAQEMGLGEPSTMSGFLEPFRVGDVQQMLLNQTTHIDTSRARDDLGWQPEFTTKSAGLDRMFMQWHAESAPATVPQDDTDSESESSEITPA